MVLQYELSIFVLILSVHCGLSQNIDCIEGEIWFEKCKKCECLGKQKYVCQWHISSCNILTTQRDIVVFESDRRCHYSSEKQTTICVDMKLQEGINGKSCIAESSFIHDTSTFCDCEKFTETYNCYPVANWSASKGMCNPGKIVMENVCFECYCTFTRFRICSPSRLCFSGQEKLGKCPTVHRHVYPITVLRNICTFERYQECYTDFGCPGTQKCCHVTDCFLRCVDSVF